MESYARSDGHPPLLEETIGAKRARPVSAHPDRGALVAKLRGAGSCATAEIGALLVNVNPAHRTHEFSSATPGRNDDVFTRIGARGVPISPQSRLGAGLASAPGRPFATTTRKHYMLHR